MYWLTSQLVTRVAASWDLLQQAGQQEQGGFGSRVRSLFRGSNQMKVGVESPVPCEPVAQVRGSEEVKPQRVAPELEQATRPLYDYNYCCCCR